MKEAFQACHVLVYPHIRMLLAAALTCISCRDTQFWKEKITDYVSFPNPINTVLPHVGTIYRLHMVMQAQASPGHVIRCVCGSALRLVVRRSHSPYVQLPNSILQDVAYAPLSQQHCCNILARLNDRGF